MQQQREELVQQTLHQTQKRKYRFDFRNGVFEGSVVQYKKQGFGVVIFDDGVTYIGNWHNDKVNGQALLFIPNVGVIFGNFSKGTQIGLQVIRLYKFPNEYFCVDIKDPLKAPQSTIIYIKDAQSAVQATVKGDGMIECSEVKLDLEKAGLIEQFDQLSMQFTNEFKIMRSTSLDGLKYIKLGFMSGPQNRMSGVGLVIEEDSWKVIKQGQFAEDKLDGLGKIVMLNEDVFEGIFKSDLIDGKGFYYTAKTNSYVQGVFKREMCKEFISSGLEYPSVAIKKLKQNFHEGSINFYSSSFSMRDFISIDWNYLGQFTDRQNYLWKEDKRNSSPGIANLLERMNTSNNSHCQGRVNSSNRESFSSQGNYSFQQNNFQNNIFQNEKATDFIHEIKILNPQNQLNPIPSSRRSNSITGYRTTPLPHQFQSHQNSINNSYNSSANKFQSTDDKSINSQQFQSKYSRKYVIERKEHQVENPEVQISNSQIDFGKLNWGTKPKGEDLHFAQTNYDLENQGQNLYSILNKDEVYQKESRINYFKNNGRIPSYEDTIREGELIKKRLMDMNDFDQVDESVPYYSRQHSGSAQKTQRNSNSQQSTYRSYNQQNGSQTKSEQSTQLQFYKSGQNHQNSSKINDPTKDLIQDVNSSDQSNMCNIRDFLNNFPQNEQDNYLNTKIDNSHLQINSVNKHHRNLVPYAPHQSGRQQVRPGCESSQSDYSDQQYDIKKRSSSVSSCNGAQFGKSVASCLDKNGEILPNEVPIQFDKTTFSKYSPSILNQQNNLNQENGRKLQQSLEGKSQKNNNGVEKINSNHFNQSNSSLEDKKDIQLEHKQEEKILNQLNNSIPVTSLQSSISTFQPNQPMKFIKSLGVPHSNKNDQLGVYLKMKEESQKQKEQQDQQVIQNLIIDKNNLDLTPITHNNATKTGTLNSSRMSILHAYMNPDSCSLNGNSNKSPTDTLNNMKRLNIKENTMNLTQRNMEGQNNNNETKKQFYLPTTEKNSEYVFTFSNSNTNQSSMISNNSYNQIPNEFEYNQINKIQNDIGAMKERHRIKLNNILYQSKQQNPQFNNPNNLLGYSEGMLTENAFESGQNNKVPYSTLPIHRTLTQTTDSTPFHISKTQQSDIDQLSIKNKSMVRFNLSTDAASTSQRQSSFSYKRQQTPEKSSLKGNTKLNALNLNGSDQKVGQHQQQRLSTSIDLQNKRYHYSENPENLFYMNTLQKTQNQWLDLYSVNPQILANTSPQKTKYVTSHNNQRLDKEQQQQQQYQQQMFPQLV